MLNLLQSIAPFGSRSGLGYVYKLYHQISSDHLARLMDLLHASLYRSISAHLSFYHRILKSLTHSMPFTLLVPAVRTH